MEIMVKMIYSSVGFTCHKHSSRLKNSLCGGCWRDGVCMWIWIIRCPAFWLIVLRMHFQNKSRRPCVSLLSPVDRSVRSPWVCRFALSATAIATSWWQQLQLHVFNCTPHDVNETNYNKLRQLLLGRDRFIRHKMKLLCNFSPVRTLDLFWIFPQLYKRPPLNLRR